MASIHGTPAGNWRVTWRDPSGRQCSKTFPSKREARAFVAEITSSLNRGTYLDPRAGKAKFGPFAHAWLASRNIEQTSAVRDASYLRTHVLPKWEAYPFGGITHSMMQAWITELSGRLAPATVAKVLQLTSNIFASAIRDRLISVNPCEGVKLPAIRRTDDFGRVVTVEEFRDALLPEIPDRYRALVALAGGCGLRWGEDVGLCLDAVSLKTATVSVIRSAIEVNGNVSIKPYPKTKGSRRTIPVPGWVCEVLERHLKVYPSGPVGQIFTNLDGGPVRRSLFRSRVWRPALVRAGLLGSVTDKGDGTWLASWLDSDDLPCVDTANSRSAAIRIVTHKAGPGLRFHDLRHSYATWLVSAGVPINEVARVLGHSQISTTLNRYTHVLPNPDERIRKALG